MIELIELTPEMVVVVMFGTLLVAVLSGYPLAFVLGGIALAVGYLAWGDGVTHMLYMRLYGILTEYVFLAAPLFIFMGIMVERSGITERLFSALYLWMGGLRGGLAIATILIGTIMAAAVGIIGASVVMLGLIALPAMMSRGYNKSLAAGAICSGGSLGILIPPSIMLVIYGPTANISVGKLFMAAFLPGLLLSGLYIGYIAVRCLLDPSLGPAMPASERQVSFRYKMRLLVTSLVPAAVLIMAVLGSIFFGIAAPTEAAALGALFATLLALAYRSLTFTTIKETVFQTARTTSMVLFIAIGAAMFTGTFLALGGGDVVTNAFLAVPFGKWGAFLLLMVLLFVLGMFIDWIGIILIMVPLVTPIGNALGFDPVWFAMMIIVNLQMSFITPPFAYALFFLKGIVKPEWNVTTGDIIRGVLPYTGLIALGLLLMALFPEIITWLPSITIR